MSNPESQRQQKNHAEARRKLRRRLEADGTAPADIERAVADLSATQAKKRAASRRARSVIDLPGTRKGSDRSYSEYPVVPR